MKRTRSASRSPSPTRASPSPPHSDHDTSQGEVQSDATDATESVEAQSVEAGPHPMPFPGPFAFAPLPAAMQAGALPAQAPVASAAPESQTTSAGTSRPDTAVPPNAFSSEKQQFLKGLPALHRAAHQGDLATLIRLLEVEGADVNQTEEMHGISALMIAAEAGHADIVDALLQRPGIKLDAIRKGKSVV